jgi:SpoVK/Ycf46/Vps4 family AAA+-type ATPase
MKDGGLKKSGRWTRDGILNFSLSPFESFDKLVLTSHLKIKLEERLKLFLQGQESFHELNLPWRHGIFLYGTSGSGKTAAGRAVAHRLGWYHLAIPAHEILDSHLFERALSDAVSQSQRVIVLEDVDLMVRTMEPETFFTLLDHAMERAEGTFWIANSKHPENVPKTQLLRPGRFDESIRLDLPSAELRSELVWQLLTLGGVEIDENRIREWVDQSSNLTFAHFEELRQITARMKLEKKDPSDYWPAFQNYIEDQMIAGDRWGGLSDQTEQLQERVQQIDPRILMAALDMTDVFRQLMEKVIGDAAEEAKLKQSQNEVGSQ